MGREQERMGTTNSQKKENGREREREREGERETERDKERERERGRKGRSEEDRLGEIDR